MTAGFCLGCRAPLMPSNPVRIWCSEECRRHYRDRTGTRSRAAADVWDGHTQRSDPGYPVTRYEATCLACGEAVEPTDASAWRRAVLSLRCERCGGRMLIDPIDVGGLRSSVQGRITRRTDDRPLRTRVAG